MIDNVADIIAIELLAAAQGIEFHRPKMSSPVIEAVIVELRQISPAYEKDRSLSSDIRRVAAIVDHGAYLEHSASILPSLSS
jgi:histidine ammonia-lyase